MLAGSLLPSLSFASHQSHLSEKRLLSLITTANEGIIPPFCIIYRKGGGHCILRGREGEPGWQCIKASKLETASTHERTPSTPLPVCFVCSGICHACCGVVAQDLVLLYLPLQKSGKKCEERANCDLREGRVKVRGRGREGLLQKRKKKNIESRNRLWHGLGWGSI